MLGGRSGRRGVGWPRYRCVASRRRYAQRYADLLIAADPVDERAVREAMAAAVAAGDRLGATRRLEVLAARLEAEFGAPQGDAAASRAPSRRFPYPAVLGREREREITELAERLQHEDSRLITLLGPGGIRKTTLARALVRETYPMFTDGAFMASLAGAVGPDVVALAVAGATGVRIAPQAPALAQVLRALSVLRWVEDLLAGVTPSRS